MTATAPRSDPATAPEPLAAVQDFLNTLHVERGTDELGDTRSAQTWLLRAGHHGSHQVSGDELDELRNLRGTLRDLVTTGDPTHAADDVTEDEGDDAGVWPSVAERLARVAAAATYVPQVGADGALHFRAEGDGVSSVIGTLILALHDAQHEGTWRRLKIRRNDACAWAFYDYSRNHSGTWCAMGICGNRTKVARHRARRRQAD